MENRKNKKNAKIDVDPTKKQLIEYKLISEKTKSKKGV